MKKILKKLSLIISIIVIGFVAIFLLTDKPRVPKVQAATDQTIGDQNNDGVINLVDARMIAPPATTSCPVCVDVNQDKAINQKDIDLLKYYVNLGNKVYKARLDINNDGVISQDDIDIVQNYLGQSVTGPAFGLDNPSELTFGFRAGEVIVKYKKGVEAAAKNAASSKNNLVHKNSLKLINADQYKVSVGNVESLQKEIAKDSTVESVYKNHVGEWSWDPYWSDQWGNRKIKIPETWYTETIGRATGPVKVGIIDSGLDVDNPDLEKNLSGFRMNFSDPYGDPFDVTDEIGHGTSIAGIIGATVDNNIGIAGVNHNVEIIPVKVSFGDPDDFSVSIALEWLTSRLQVINMSFGMGYLDESNYLPKENLRLAREDYGISLIAAAGNEGRDDCQYPARNSSVVCVGATDQSDDLCGNTNGRVDADILAPGKDTVTTFPVGHPVYDPDGNGIGYIPDCNTSTAAALVTGVTALCRAVEPLPISNEITREDLKCKNMTSQGSGRIIDAWKTIWYKNCWRR